VRWFVVAVLLAAASASKAAEDGPYKLIITWYQSNVTVIDYPNSARCEKAKLAVEAEVARRNREAAEKMPQGGVIIGASPNGAFCIPG
jgi:hypothetical protein